MGLNGAIGRYQYLFIKKKELQEVVLENFESNSKQLFGSSNVLILIKRSIFIENPHDPNILIDALIITEEDTPKLLLNMLII